MKIRNIIAVILLSTCITVPIKTTVQPINTISAHYETASGLIEKCSVNCSCSEGNLKIYAKTQASGTMDKIGFINIIIQKSTDLKNWTDEKNLGDFIESDRKYYTLNHNEKVSGGFYYRIVCTHYANGLTFQNNSYQIQTAENISKSVWIDYQPPEPVHTTAQTTITDFTTTTNASVPAPAPTLVTTCSANTTTLTNTTLKATQITKSSEKIIQNKTDTSSSKKSTVTLSYKDSPTTAVNFPSSALISSALAIISAIISHRKSR